MPTCSKCNKNIDCALWPTSWGKYLCVKTHEALDSEGMDDIFNDLNSLSKVSPENQNQVKTLASRLERSLRLKARNPNKINKKSLKKYSYQLAIEIIEGKESDKTKYFTA